MIIRQRLLPAEQHLIKRLVAFFATGDSIVANNLVLNLYKHLNSPEARLFLSRQLFEEAQHVQFYLTLLDTYVPDLDERAEAFAAIENIPSIRVKADFCFKWMDEIGKLDTLETAADRKTFLLNLICFAACIEGLFFFAAFAYVYFLRSKGLLNGLAAGTNWVFRDESGHMDFAFAAVDVIRLEEPELFDAEFAQRITNMVEEAVEVEAAFAADVIGGRRVGFVAGQLAPVSRVRRRSATHAFGDRQAFWRLEPAGLHDAPRRRRAHELLRAHGLRVPSWRRRRCRLRRIVLAAPPANKISSNT